MNAKDRARRSDALHYGTDSRRALCDRIANLESDLEDARKECEQWQAMLKSMKRRVQQ